MLFIELHGEYVVGSVGEQVVGGLFLGKHLSQIRITKITLHLLDVFRLDFWHFWRIHSPFSLNQRTASCEGCERCKLRTAALQLKWLKLVMCKVHIDCHRLFEGGQKPRKKAHTVDDSLIRITRRDFFFFFFAKKLLSLKKALGLLARGNCLD